MLRLVYRLEVLAAVAMVAAAATRIAGAALGATIAVFASVATVGAHGGIAPVADLNPNGGKDGVHYGFERMGDVAYFVGSSVESGRELWRTDGTEAGTNLVVDLEPGPAGSSPWCLTAIGGRLYFSAEIGTDGRQAWVSDGTAAGTRRLIPDLASDALAAPCEFTEAADVVFFVAASRRLWRTDGTADGTILLGEGGSVDGIESFEGEVFFAQSGVGLGTELWATDGTLGGTRLVKDLRPGPDGSFPRALRRASGGVVFVANVEGSSVDEVWSSDGTEAGTKPVFGADNLCGWTSSAGDEVYFPVIDGARCTIVRTDGTMSGTHVVQALPSTYSSRVHGIRPFGDRLLFAAGWHDLYSLDPTTGAVQHLMHSEECYSPFFHMVPFAGQLYFRALYDRGRELYRTDGTPEGTGPVPPFPPRGTRLRDASGLTALGDKLLFTVRDLEHGLEPWVTDGTLARTHLLREVNASTGHGLQRIQSVGGTVFLEVTKPPTWGIGAGAASSLRGPRLWSTDGSEAGTRPVAWATGFQRAAVVAGDEERTFFIAQETYDRFGASGLYLYDRAKRASRRLADVFVGTLWSGQGRLIGTNLLYTPDGRRSWVSDGTPEGTVQVPIEHPDLRVAEFDDVVLLSGSGTLQRTDGTAAGTKTLRPDLQVANRSPVTRVGTFGYFQAFQEGGELGLWRTDGTVAGTTLVRLLPNPIATTRSNYAYEAVAWRGALYFTVPNAGGGFDLWRSDGTADGTTRIAPISKSSGRNPPSLTPSGHQLFFAGDDGVHGKELMVTDGTEAGTRVVADLVQGRESSEPSLRLALDEEGVYFVADDGVHGRELWFSDGTGDGTFLVDDLRPGPRGSGIRALHHTPAGVLFSANDGLTGRELFKLTCGDGRLEEPEPCDLGAYNGAPASCCAAGCRLVAAEADLSRSCALDVDRASLRRRPGRAARGDRVRVRAHIGAGAPLDASAGIVVALRAAGGLLAAIEWDAGDCQERRRGWQCLRDDASLDVRRRSTGATVIRLRAQGFALPETLAGPVELAVGPPSGPRIRSLASSCRGDARRLVCQP